MKRKIKSVRDNALVIATMSGGGFKKSILREMHGGSKGSAYRTAKDLETRSEAGTRYGISPRVMDIKASGREYIAKRYPELLDAYLKDQMGTAKLIRNNPQMVFRRAAISQTIYNMQMWDVPYRPESGKEMTRPDFAGKDLLEHEAYYDPLCVKQKLDPKKMAGSNSRMCGLYITGRQGAEQAFIIYDMEDRNLKFHKRDEENIKTMIENYILRETGTRVRLTLLITADDISMFDKIIDNAKPERKTLDLISRSICTTYNGAYFIPNNEPGYQQFKLLGFNREIEARVRESFGDRIAPGSMWTKDKKRMTIVFPMKIGLCNEAILQPDDRLIICLKSQEAYFKTHFPSEDIIVVG